MEHWEPDVETFYDKIYVEKLSFVTYKFRPRNMFLRPPVSLTLLNLTISKSYASVYWVTSHELSS